MTQLLWRGYTEWPLVNPGGRLDMIPRGVKVHLGQSVHD
jgi:hypothetical protein